MEIISVDIYVQDLDVIETVQLVSLEVFELVGPMAMMLHRLQDPLCPPLGALVTNDFRSNHRIQSDRHSADVLGSLGASPRLGCDK